MPRPRSPSRCCASSGGNDSCVSNPKASMSTEPATSMRELAQPASGGHHVTKKSSPIISPLVGCDLDHAATTGATAIPIRHLRLARRNATASLGRRRAPNPDSRTASLTVEALRDGHNEVRRRAMDPDPRLAAGISPRVVDSRRRRRTHGVGSDRAGVDGVRGRRRRTRAIRSLLGPTCRGGLRDLRDLSPAVRRSELHGCRAVRRNGRAARCVIRRQSSGSHRGARARRRRVVRRARVPAHGLGRARSSPSRCSTASSWDWASSSRSASSRSSSVSPKAEWEHAAPAALGDRRHRLVELGHGGRRCGWPRRALRPRSVRAPCAGRVDRRRRLDHRREGIRSARPRRRDRRARYRPASTSFRGPVSPVRRWSTWCRARWES